MDGDGELGRFVAGSAGGDLGSGYSPAGNGDHSDGDNSPQSEEPQPAPTWPAAYERESSYAERQQPRAIKRDTPPLG